MKVSKQSPSQFSPWICKIETHALQRFRAISSLAHLRYVSLNIIHYTAPRPIIITMQWKH